LKFLLNQTISTVAQQCWLVKLLGYDYEIEYKQGKENFVVDALSRIEAPQTLMAISHPIHHWLELFKMKFTRIQSCNLQALVVRIQAGEAVGQWKFQGGLIFFKERVYLSSTSSHSFHHYRNTWGALMKVFLKTMKRLRAVFYWPKMKELRQGFH
jgi:hypothetical protein